MQFETIDSEEYCGRTFKVYSYFKNEMLCKGRITKFLNTSNGRMYYKAKIRNFNSQIKETEVAISIDGRTFYLKSNVSSEMCDYTDGLEWVS